MKIKSIPLALICLGLATAGFAQDFKQVVADDIQRYKERLETTEQRVKRASEGLEEETAKVKNLRRRIEALKMTRVNRKDKIESFRDRLERARKDLPWLKRKVGGEGKVLRCMIEAVEDGKELSGCRGLDKIDPELAEEAKTFDEGLGLEDSAYQKKLAEEENDVKRALERRDSYQRSLKVYENNLDYWDDKIQERQADLSLYEEFKNRTVKDYGCGPETATIDLEADAENSGLGKAGVFHGLGRDHQNGLGTCFANTAKNLLYAATNGEVNASFLDMALHYKDENSPDIEGGGSCPTLSRIHEKGYCPKRNSPLETGEKMPPTGLINGATSVSEQSYMMDLLAGFLENKNQLKKEGLDAKILKNAPRLIQALRSDPLIELPMPSIGLDPVNPYKVNEYFYWGYPEDKRGNLDFEDFKKEFSGVKEKFDFAVANEVRKNGDFSLESLAKEIVEPFLKKHHVDQEWRDKILVPDLDEKLKNFDRDEYLRKLESTQNFIALIDPRGKRDGDFDLDEFLAPSCRSESAKILSFGAALEELVDYVQDRDIDAMILADQDGFKANRELLQLAIAPNCLNSENRKPSPDVYCSAFNVQNKTEDFGAVKTEFTRFRALRQLRKGLPVGNTYHTGIGWHINTVVGFRFNPESKSCEYKIRESQTATAFWMDEGELSQKISRMTVVDK